MQRLNRQAQILAPPECCLFVSHWVESRTRVLMIIWFELQVHGLLHVDDLLAAWATPSSLTCNQRAILLIATIAIPSVNSGGLSAIS